MNATDPGTLREFLDEAGELVESLQGGLLRLEAGGEVERGEVLNQLFRAAHSLKGASGMVGLKKTAELTHSLEEVLDAMRAGRLALSPGAIDALFSAVDVLTTLVAALAGGEGEGVETASVRQALLAVIPTRHTAPSFVSTLPVSPDVRALLSEADDLNLFVAEQTDRRILELRFPGELKPEGSIRRRLEDLSEILALVEAEKRTVVLAATHLDDARFLESLGVSDVALRDLRRNEEPETADRARYLDLFLAESEEEIEGLGKALLKLEGEERGAAVHEAFRYAHRLKGGAAAMGFASLSGLCHRLEDSLAALRDAVSPITDREISRLLEESDGIRAALGRIRAGEKEIPFSPSTGSVLPEAGRNPWDLTEFERTGIEEAREAGGRIRDVVIRFEEGTVVSGVRAELVVSNLENHGQVLAVRPTRRDLVALNPASFRLLLVTDADGEDLRRAASVDQVAAVAIDDFPGPEASRPQDTAVEAAPASKPSAGETPARSTAGREIASARSIRVDLEKLDALMNMAGELVVVKARFQRLAEQMALELDMKDLVWAIEDLEQRAQALSDGGRMAGAIEKMGQRIRGVSATRSRFAEFEASAQQLSRVSSAIQNGVMAARMLPVGSVFNRFPRLVRDLSRQFQKEVVLEIAGEETELDKRVIDELGDPLTHLIRNSLDHGIETPQERVKGGKAAGARLRLSAYREGSLVCIRVEDDGRGIDRGRVLARARDRGLLPAEATPADAEILGLIFLPGFSTAERISDVSGRGVGMDIVKSRIEELKGSIAIESREGEGTAVTLRIPLTLTILKALLVEDGGVMLAVPVEQISEIVKLGETDLKTVEGRLVTVVRGKVIPVHGLSSSLGLEHAGAPGPGYAVIVQTRSGSMACRVKRLIGEEEVVVKALPDEMAHVQGLTGATILGDGRIALIVDAAGHTARLGAGERLA